MGVILKSAIRKFEARSRKDFRPWKKFSEDKLVDIRDRRLPHRPPIWNVLRKHQKVCLLIGAIERQFGFFLDTGMGKTFLIIALFRYFKKLLGHQEPMRRHRWLILVPNKTNKSEWVREVQKHAPSLDIVRLHGSSADKWADLKAAAKADELDFAVETYAGLMHMLSDRVPDQRKAARKKKKMRMKWSAKLISELCDICDGLILDESIKVMNKSALPHRIAYQLRKRMKFTYELNATAFGRDPTSIWGQVYLLDLGKTLGETLGLFRATFFTEKKAYWGNIEYTFDKSKERQLHDFLAARTIEYEADEGDLPKVQPIIKRIHLPADAEAYAEEAKRMVIAAKGNYQESKNAFNRMRQISSGWLGYKDDETGERASVNFKPNVKLEFLLDYVDSISLKYKYLIFHEYNYSGAMICAGLKEMGIKHRWIYGKTKDPDAALNAFVNDPSIPALVLSNAAGAYGLNLQIAKYGIYFEAPVSPIIRYQTRKRFERQYSPHKTVFRVDLVVAGTYDDTILAFHEQGKDLFDAIIRGRFKSRKSGVLVPA